MRLPFLSCRCLLFFAVTASLVFSQSGEAIAAERVVLKYGPMRAPLSVAELSTFAQTGEMSAPLQTYLSLAKQEPQAVRENLTKSVDVSPLFLDRVLNNRMGAKLLDQVAEFVHTPSDSSNRQALRAALVLSASGDSQISLMETIQNYPAESVEVDVASLARTYRKLRFLKRFTP